MNTIIIICITNVKVQWVNYRPGLPENEGAKEREVDCDRLSFTLRGSIRLSGRRALKRRKKIHRNSATAPSRHSRQAPPVIPASPSRHSGKPFPLFRQALPVIPASPSRHSGKPPPVIPASLLPVIPAVFSGNPQSEESCPRVQSGVISPSARRARPLNGESRGVGRSMKETSGKEDSGFPITNVGNDRGGLFCRA